MAAYDFINQPIQASLLITVKDDDPFFNPVALALTGFSADGFWYDAGVKTGSQASWFTEGEGPHRGPLQQFPQAALVLLSQVSMTVLDVSNAVQTSSMLPLWMQALLGDSLALTNNFEDSQVGFTPSGLTYAAGIVTVTYTPDAGSAVQSSMAVNFDFTADSVHLYVGVTP